jgi:2-dehydro-3-deoxyphosphogluconate aldolase/(4S)-4-hydroxy-2-oxoglutarate aldolase
MAKFRRIDIIQSMERTGVVPIFFNKDPDICRKVILSCYNGGLKIFEFTNRGDYAHEIFSDLNKWAEKETPGMMMGVGSVVDAATAALYIQAGASFVVSPVLNPEMARVCNRRKILWIPGCGSVSEISYAEELGAEIIKIFPAPAVGGPDFIRAVMGPCPWSNLMPTGGVETTEKNLREWFSTGVTCVGIGSNLITKEIIRNSDWEGLIGKVTGLLKTIELIRNNK